MKNGLAVIDSGPVFSLAIINRLSLLDLFFDEVKVPTTVWNEITLNTSSFIYPAIAQYFSSKIEPIRQAYEVSSLIDPGENDAILLYKEIDARFLIIDDKKGREIAEQSGISCIGTLGLLALAKDKGYIKALKPIFETFLKNKRYYSIYLLNALLESKNEKPFFM